MIGDALSAKAAAVRAIDGQRRLTSLVLADDEILKTIRGLTSPLAYPKDVELFQQDALPGEVYFIESGMVKLVRVEHDGQELIVDLRAAGFMLGTAAAILGKPLPVSAVTLTACRLLRIPSEEFLRCLKSNDRFARYILHVQSCEVFEQVNRVAQLGCLSAQERLKCFLVQLFSAIETSSHNKEIRFQLPLKRWELAQLVGVTPEHISRILKQMHKDGILKFEKGWVVISRPDLMLNH